jgi:hypothetical protein
MGALIDSGQSYCMWPVRHVSISIDRPLDQVYAFVADPMNLPRWASGLASGITRDADGAWHADSPMGRVRVRFAEHNAFGVLDHDVTLPSGETVHNAMRVLPNDRGSELTFTLFRRAGVGDDEFEADARAVTKDLATLKALVERS